MPKAAFKTEASIKFTALVNKAASASTKLASSTKKTFDPLCTVDGPVKPGEIGAVPTFHQYHPPPASVLVASQQFDSSIFSTNAWPSTSSDQGAVNIWVHCVLNSKGPFAKLPGPVLHKADT